MGPRRRRWWWRRRQQSVHFYDACAQEAMTPETQSEIDFDDGEGQK